MKRPDSSGGTGILPEKRTFFSAFVLYFLAWPSDQHGVVGAVQEPPEFPSGHSLEEIFHA